MNFKKISWILITMLIVSSMLLAACQPAAEEPVVEEEPMVEEPMADDGTYYGRAMAGEFAGTVVTMTGPFTDEDAVKFDNSVAAFEEATGIDIQYEGSKEFEASIGIRVEAGDPPDIVDFPQPGLLATFVAQGEVVDVSSYLPESSIENYNPSWWQMATMAGPDGPIVAGVWHRFNAKSQVWYPKAAFEAAGYAIPTTWDEMLALSDQIVADGDTPWCVGIESGAATGWPATDWMEEVMLRTTSLENYDKWVTGELPFSSPEVKNALTVLTELWSDAYVYGGQEAIVTTFFGDAPTPMFEEPPKCWLHKQGNFITSFFPEGVVAGEDYGFFYLPGLDEAYGSPYLVAGDIMAQFNDRDEVRAVMEFFTKGEALKEWLAAGGALAPQMDTDLNWYGDEIEKGIAALVADATSVRFDGSDLMPGEVGAGSFWKGMTDYFSGTADMDTVMAEIDASWPGHEGMMEEAPAAEEPAMEEGMAAPTFDGTFKVAIVMPSAITDLAFSQSMYDALLAVQEWLGGEAAMEIVYSEGMFVVDDAAAAIRDYASEGYNLVIAHGSQYGSSLQEIAPDFPETSFAWGTTVDTFDLPNIFAYEAASQQGGYVNGVLAASLSESGVIGVVGPIETGDAKLYVDGFVAGAQATNPDVQVNVNYIGSFSDVALAAEAANTHIAAGADVLTGTAQMVVGAIGVAEESGVLWFGTQASQTALAPGIVVANQVYHWEVVLKEMVSMIAEGTYGGQAFVIDLAGGGEVLEYNADFVLADDVKALADGTVQGIIDGSIVIDLGDRKSVV